ncbi:hypothetical protein [Glycomyces sp. YM15]|uniref:hypothetical protein n=1 Tax=Glycomyces sp. YM15 TaxID=2800446 RepID=UPI00196358A6|nr:hypothetical protein [Glycomyces sp. YM15]
MAMSAFKCGSTDSGFFKPMNSAMAAFDGQTVYRWFASSTCARRYRYNSVDLAVFNGCMAIQAMVMTN